MSTENAASSSIFKRMDHVGLIVNSLDETLKTYCDQLGFVLQERITIPSQKVEAAFLDAGNGTIELISPTDSDSGSAKFLANRGEGTHHLCFEVDDIVAALEMLRAQGVRLIDEAPRQGPHGLVAFVHPKATHGMMIELLQKTHHE
jgi:methylmalonyl-CoA epimerase